MRFILLCYLLFLSIPAVSSLRAAQFTFTSAIGTNGWYDVEVQDDSDPNCVVLKNNWGKTGCPPAFPTPIDTVELEKDVQLDLVASVISLTSESMGGSLHIGTTGILGVTLTLDAMRPVRVDGLLGASAIHHTDILRVLGGSVDTMSLDSDGNVEIVNGNLSITDLSGTANYSVKSGKLLSFTGGLIAVDQFLEIQNGGSFSWDSGEVVTPQVTFQSGSNVTVGSAVSSSFISNLNGGTLNNFSTVQILGSQWWINAGAIVNNQGMLQFSGGDPLVDTTTEDTGTIENLGTVQSSATSARLFRTVLNNKNLVMVDSGKLDIAGGGESTATFQIASGAELLFGGPTFNSFYPPYLFKNGTTISGDGFARVVSGVVVAEGHLATAENFHVEGVLSAGGGGTLEVNNVLRFSSGIIQGGTTRILPSAELHIEDGAGGNDTVKLFDGVHTLDNQGLTTWTGEGQLWINGGSTFHNAASAMFEIQNATIMDTTSQTSGTFDNDGTLRKTSGGTTRINRTLLENHGLVQVDSGTLDVAGGGTSDAPFMIAPSAELLFGTNFPTQVYTVGNGTTFSGGGLLHVTGALAVATGATVPAERLHLEGQLIGPGTMSISNTLDWTAGSQSIGRTVVQAGAQLNITGAADKLLSDGHVLENHGKATWQGTGKLLVNGSEFRNESDQTFIVANSAEMDTTSQASGSFNNLGTFRKTSGGTSRINRTLFHNQGLVDIQNGTLDISGGGTSSGDFALAGGTIVQFGTNTPTQTYTLQTGTDFEGAGTARVTGAVSIGTGHLATADNFELIGSVSGAGTLRVDNQFDLSSGTLSGGTTRVEETATMNISGTATKTLANAHTLDLFGMGTWAGTGALNVNGGSRIVVQSSGSLDIETDALVDSPAFPAGMVDVQGNLTKSSSNGTSRFARTLLNNQGTVQVSSGILQLAGGGQSSGAFSVDGGATLEFAFGSTYTLGAGTTISGAGFAQVTGIVQIPSGANVPADRVDYVGGLIVGLGSLTINDELRLAGGLNKTFDTLTVENNGTTDWTGTGQLLLNNGAAFNNNAAGIFVDEVDETIDTNDFPQGTFNNGGTWIKRNSAGTTRFFRTPLNNTGLVDVQSGTLRLEAGGSFGGSFQMAGAAAVQLAAGLYTLGNGTQFGGNGLLQLNGGTALVPAAAAVSMNNADLTAGSLGVDGQLTINGTFNWTGGALAINNMGTIVNNSPNSFNASASATVTHSGAATAHFHNVGTFQKTAATGTTRYSAGIAFDNSGTTNIGINSTLQLSGGGMSSGPFHAGSGGLLLFDGFSPYVWNAGTVIDGQGFARVTGVVEAADGATVPVDRLQLAGGTIGQAGVVQVNNDFSWTAGTLTMGTLAVQPGAIGTIAGPGGMSLNGHTMANYGALLWTGGSVSAANSPTINNHAGAVIDIQNSASLAGPGALNNDGLLVKTAGAATTLIGLDTTNTGTVQASSGTLQFTGGFSQTDGTTILAGGNLASSAPMNFFGGALEGSGSIAGQVNNLGAIVSPGNSPGVIAIAGGYSQGPDGHLAIDIFGIDAGEFDHVDVTAGSAMLDGTLDVALVGYVPTAGDTFTILTAAGGQTGMFATHNLPMSAGGVGISWQVNYNANNVTLEVFSTLQGDFNGNGVVDAADYVVWRKELGTVYTQADYAVWRSHFGQSAGGSGSLTSAVAAGPEPAAALLLLIGMAVMFTGSRMLAHNLADRKPCHQATMIEKLAGTSRARLM